MQEHYDDIRALGADVLGISVAAAYQAEHLMGNGIEFELLLDPDRSFKTDALHVSKLRLRTYLLPATMWRYAKWAFTARQGKITAGLTEPPAVAIVDTTGSLRYVYRGKTLGDYPPIEDVLEQLRRIVS